MVGTYRQWRHAGEENAIAVYHYSISLELALLAGMFALIWLGLRLVSVQDERILILLTLPYLLTTLAKRRIAVIFTETDLIVRPALAWPLRVRLQGIQSIRRGPIVVNWECFLRESRVEGMILKLPYNQSVPVRLDLPRADEIVKRLRDVTRLRVS